MERIGDQAEDIAEIVISGQVNEGEELLRDMYRIPLTVADIPLAGGPAKGCVYGE